MDSVGHAVYATLRGNYMEHDLRRGYPDSAEVVRRVAEEGQPFDSIYAFLPEEAKSKAWRTASTRAQSMKNECEFRRITTEDNNRTYRRHQMEAHKKFTLSLACLLFFFIGAPLGAIIRKGGLGVPVVISVVIFIFYYIINVGSEKMAKTGPVSYTHLTLPTKA